ncbi:Ankyrin-repeat protein with F-box domain [Orpheovirus IHUMI-LCC2]|uniref:Ankyrin-repeat protein with F-box domain n=1 Tax=Orpheovirus IHUMI-LCC2 TaxID=2023057 RepID=A0A2I2L4W8_9VIRU|nr:Ankyrin-repeat protein with F-box domain [Orpheovirus IHUMI-LCC2]SNW62550.1 Ankyrin-repeat protein with F-box domain [Orpheovirus IHUMI-LCC2]
MEEYNFSNIPNELLFTILDDLDVDSITSLCKSNKDNNIVCSKEYDDYWKGRFSQIFDDYKLVGLDGNVLDREFIGYASKSPLYTYNSVEDYNKLNNTKFSNWYQIVDDVYTELQYANEVLKINNDYDYRIERKKKREEEIEEKKRKAKEEGYKYIEADDIENKKESTSDVENLFDLVVNQIKISNLEVLNYMNSYFIRNMYGGIHNKSGMIESLFKYVAFYSNRIIYEYFRKVYGKSQDKKKFMRYALKGGNLDMIKYFNEHGVSLNDYKDSLYYIILSDADEETTKEILELLFSAGVKPTWSEVNMAIDLGRSDILDIIGDNGHKFSIKEMNHAIEEGNYDMVLYFIEKGIIPSNDSLYYLAKLKPEEKIYFNDIMELVFKYVDKLSARDMSDIYIHGNEDMYKYIVDNNIKVGDDIIEGSNLIYNIIINLTKKYSVSNYINYGLKSGVVTIQRLFWEAAKNGDIFILDYLIGLEKGTNIKLYSAQLEDALIHKKYDIIIYLGKLLNANMKFIIIEEIKRENLDVEFINFLRDNFGDISIDDKNELLVNVYNNGYIKNIKYLLDIGADIYAIPNIVEEYIKYNGNKNYNANDIIKFVMNIRFSKDYLLWEMKEAVMNDNMKAVMELIRKYVYPTNELVQLAKDLGYIRLANFMKYYVK